MASTKEIYAKGHTYVVTRRIIQRPTQTVLRVRVRAYAGMAITGKKPVLNEFRDYVHLAEGDAIYAGHIKKLSAL